MKPLDLVRAGLRYHARTHAGVVAGCAVAAAVLTGALVVGDSVRHSLRKQALQRIGQADAVLAGGERFFRAALADEIEGAPVLQLAGMASNRPADGQTGDRRANDVQVLGVDARFFELALTPLPAAEQPDTGELLLNERLARQLGAQPGDEILLRVPKPSAMPRDLVMTPNDELSLGLRARVRGILSDDAYGRFGLAASQLPPHNALVPLAWLQEQLELDGRANLILAAGADAHQLDAALKTAWEPADGQLTLRDLPDLGIAELRSERVFLDRVAVETAARFDWPATGVLTYFVNELRAGERATPYSLVAAVGPLSPVEAADDEELPTGMAWSSLVPADLGDDEIVVDDWLAEDLAVGPGDTVTLDYFLVDEAGKLTEDSRSFQVRGVVPIEGLAADPELMPPFSGLAEAESCRDWEPGVPIDLERLRDKDQDWWDAHRGTPKAFVSLTAGQSMWANRFGSLTAVRFALSDRTAVQTRMRAAIAPADLGLYFRDVRAPALAASTAATDFGGLFIGLSSFLIVAALLLTAMLFAFGIEQRAGEIGLLLAVGFRPHAVRRLFLAEATLLALIGVVIGSALGLAYTRAVLAGLATIWRDAVGATALELFADPRTITLGAVIALLASVASIALAFRASLRRPAVELLSGASALQGPSGGKPRVSAAVLVVALLASIALIAGAGSGSSAAAGAFFGAGALLLIAGVAGSRLLLARSVLGGGNGRHQTVGSLGLHNSMRRPGRSLATIALLASGTFLVLSVGANRLGLPDDANERSSGTGGFTLFGNTTLGVPQDLDTPAGRDAFALEPDTFAQVAFVPMRVRAGDDASCLNLSLPQNPRLLGVRPDELAARGAFTFAAVHGGHPDDGSSPWRLLADEAEQAGGLPIVPAIGDQASVTWALHKKPGDVIEYRDESGQTFGVRIVATVASSILQGNLLIDERHFQERFPSESGYRAFLIDAPLERADAVSAALVRGLTDVGMEVVPAAARLAEFNAVQNTYLLIFQLLGGLGLLLGSVGLGMVVLRNTLERRGELAILRAVGFSVRDVRKVVLSEHALLLVLGLAAGTLAALVALLPGLGSGAAPSLVPVLAILFAVALNGAVWVRVSTAFALRGPLLAALRRE